MKIKNPKRLIKRVVCVLLSVLIGFTALSMAGSVVIFKILFGRNELGSDFEVSYNMIDSASYPRRQLSLPSGENLLNAYVYGEDNTSALVIIAPGTSDSSEAHLAEITYFADRGYRVLAYEATGVKGSGGSGTVGLQQSKLDLQAAISYSNREIGLPIVLYGHSLGAYAAATCCGEKGVEGAVCISGFNSPVETMHNLAKRYIGFLADVEYPFLCLQNFFVFGDNCNPSALDAVNATDTPVLICQGSGDPVITGDISLYSRKDMVTNPNASFVLIDEKERNLHSGLWLESESAKYLREKKLDYQSRAAEMSPGEAEAFRENVDAKLATRLDRDFMKLINDFFTSALQ